MNESKKLYTVLLGIGVIAAIIVTSLVFNNIKGQKYVDKVDKAFDNKEAQLLYLGRPTCSYCVLLQPMLESYAKKYNFKYEYINTDETGKSKLDEILGKFDLSQETFGTPYLAVVKNGKKVAEQNGYVQEDILFKFLQENGFIDEKEKLALNYIDYEEYNTLLNSDEKNIFVSVQTGCSYCEEAKPVLEKIAKKYDLKINIINITNFKDEAEKEKYMSSLSYYNEKQWGTPLMLVVENKEVKAEQNGSASEEDYIKFFKDNGFIKE